jgi:hypothetical protein
MHDIEKGSPRGTWVTAGASLLFLLVNGEEMYHLHLRKNQFFSSEQRFALLLLSYRCRRIQHFS